MSEQPSWDQNVAYALVRLGHVAHRRFADHLASLGLRPRQIGMLETLRAGPMSQLDLATALGVTASVIVDMADELQALDAIRRVRDTHDRRRQNLELTGHGRTLAAQALTLAEQLDADLLAPLTHHQTATLRGAITQLAAAHASGSQPP